MTDHPHQLLAEYVEGALEAGDRSRVEAHLASCPACLAEVDLARGARESLRQLPDLPAPPGLTFEVLRRARAPRAPRAAWRWAAAGVAAAVIGIGVFVIARSPLGQVGADRDAAAPTAGDDRPEQTPESQAQEDAEAAAEGEAAAGVQQTQSGLRFAATDRDYDTASLANLGRRLKTEARASLDSEFPQPATDYYRRFRVQDFPPPARRAAACILQELPPRELAVPFLIEEASFEGQPVYVAAFLQGPAPDEPYDRLLLWVLSREGCELRYFATLRL